MAVQAVARVLAGIRSAAVMRDFLQAILTPWERRRLVLRWRLVCLLETGLTQREVARLLGVSLCKITRGSRELKYGPVSFRKIVRQHARSRGRIRP